MKRCSAPAKAIAFLLLLILGVSTGLHGQNEPGSDVAPAGPPTSKEKEAAMADTQELFSVMAGHANKDNYAAFARHLVYEGSDPKRKMMELINYNDTFERLDCEMASNRLKEYLSRGELYNLSNFRTLSWMGAEMALWDLDVTKKSGKVKKHTVTFVKVKGRFEYVKVE